MPRETGQSAGRPLLVPRFCPREKGRKVRAPWKHGAGQCPAGIPGLPGSLRESATESRPPPACPGVRMKGWGKSPPRPQQCGRHGKPHREQDQEGVARRFLRQPVSRPATRVGRAKRSARTVPDEWPSRRVLGPGATEPGLQAGWRFLFRIRPRASRIAGAAGAACGRPGQAGAQHPFWPPYPFRPMKPGFPPAPRRQRSTSV